MVHKDKFKLQSELELFKALQIFGKLSNESLSKKTGISPTTIQSIYKRIKKRKFFNIKAVPKLEMFPELPLAVLGFTDIHPVKWKQLKEKSLENESIRILLHSEREFLIILMAESSAGLTKLIFEIMEMLKARPTLHILSPEISKLDVTIPEKVLNAVYKGLPDKRRK